jgi:hypothetical protein
LRVRLVPSVLDGHWGNSADPPGSGPGVFLVRGQDGQLRRRARLAAPLSYCGQPGSTPGGGSTCSYSNSGREVGLRSRLLRVRIPPSTPAIRSQIQACLVATVSTLPRYGSSRGSIPRAGSSTPCDRSVSGKHANLPSSQDEFESRRSLTCRTSPTGKRRLVQGKEDHGSNPWFGTQGR